MNKIILFYVKGTTYNPMYKWSSVEQFQDTLSSHKGIPSMDAVVTEAYIDDNMIDAGNTFAVTLEKYKLILGIE